LKLWHAGSSKRSASCIEKLSRGANNRSYCRKKLGQWEGGQIVYVGDTVPMGVCSTCVAAAVKAKAIGG
ncbi:hypothetical protein LCGC14_2587780, partial [marine sediment metagenome]